MSLVINISSENKSILPNNPQNEYQLTKNSPFSPVATAFSSKDYSKKTDKIIISDFQELIKPTPIKSFLPLDKNITWQNENLKEYNIFLDLIKIYPNNSKNYETSLNFLGKKRNINTRELLFQNNKTAKIEKAEEDFNINKSAFKKVEIKDNINNSAFNKKVIHIKKKLFKKNKIKADLSNKIIINETNNLNIKEDEIKEKPKIKLFNSIKYEKKTQKGNNTTEIFKIEEEEEKRRGRKPKNETSTKRVHDAFDYDNILRKIQVHYLTFIISLTNDLIECFSPNNKDLKFKNLSYDLKKIVNHSYVEKLKEKKIGDILKFKASSKNRRFNNDINEHIFQKVCNLYPFMNDFFNMNYLELFNKYYFKSNKIINFEGKSINLSKKTRVFTDLLEKNKKAAEKIQQIAINNFIEKKDKQTIFVIKK